MATQLEEHRSHKNGSLMLDKVLISKVHIFYAGLLLIFELSILVGWILGSVRYVVRFGNSGGWLLGISVLSIACLLYVRAPYWKQILKKSTVPVYAAAWIYFLALFLPGHLFFSGVSSKSHMVPLSIALLWAFIERFRQRSALQPLLLSQEKVSDGYAHRTLFVFGNLYFIATTVLAIIKFRNFGYVGQDIAYFMQCLYTGLHGQLFASNQYHDLLYTTTVHSDFAGHNQPILFLLLPFYWLFPGIETLFVLRNLSIVLCIVPAYTIARLWLRPMSAMIAVVGLMLGPVVLYQNIYDYAPLSMVGLPLLFALQFYLQKRYLPFMLMLICCLWVREDLVFVLAGIGFVAWLQGRRWKWSVVPLALAVLWTIATWEVVLPHFQAGAVSAVQGCFSYLGNSPEEMIRNIVTHPRLILTHKIAVYLAQIFSPLGGITTLTSPISFISFPYILINVLGDKGCNAAIAFRHYSLVPVLLLFPAAAGFSYWLKTVHFRLRIRESSLAILILCASITSTILATGTDEISWLRAKPWQSEAKRVANILPADAAVAVPRYMLPLVANRESVYQSLRLLEYHHPDANYIVLDRDNQRMGVSAHWSTGYQLLKQQLGNPLQFSLIYSSENYLVYKRIGVPLKSFRPATVACINGGCS